MHVNLSRNEKKKNNNKKQHHESTATAASPHRKQQGNRENVPGINVRKQAAHVNLDSTGETREDGRESTRDNHQSGQSRKHWSEEVKRSSARQRRCMTRRHQQSQL